MRYYSLLFFCFLSCLAVAQNVTIRGKAEAPHRGQEITLSTYDDLVSYTETKEAVDVVADDGYFELQLQIEHTQPAMIRIGRMVGRIYIQPGYVYGVHFPAQDTSIDKRGETDIPADIGVIGADSTELNALIIDFNDQFDSFWEKNYKSFVVKRIHHQLDSFQLASNKRYASIKSPYFKTYLNYTFANFNASTSRNKNYLMAEYITGKPIQYTHYEYMTFFNTFFKSYLKAFAGKKTGGSIYDLINGDPDYIKLNEMVQQDKLLQNDSLRELVILTNLNEFYNSPDFQPANVASLIEQLKNRSRIAEHKKIAGNILQSIYHLQPGSAAPDFTVLDRNGKEVTLSNFKGRFVYLNFFSTQSVQSLKEMPKIADLKRKYGDKIYFVSICTDDTISTYKEYLKAYPRNDWFILYAPPGKEMEQDKEARQLYGLKTVPAFFFINPQGQFLYSPALAPTDGFEYKLKGLFKTKRGNTKTGIR